MKMRFSFSVIALSAIVCSQAKAQLSNIDFYQPNLHVSDVIDSVKSSTDQTDEAEGGEGIRARLFENFWRMRAVKMKAVPVLPLV